MASMKIDQSMRIFVGTVAAFLWLGILMTGLAHASWLLYIPVAFFSFAAAVGICPGMFVSRLIAGKKTGAQQTGA